MKKNFTDEQIREVQEKRGTSRKMAIQWLKRNASKAAAPAKAAKGKANIKTYPVNGPDGKEIRVTVPEDEAPAPEAPAQAAPAPEAPKAAPAKPKRAKGEITEKRAAILASPEFKAAHEAGLAKRKKGPICKNGHNLANPEHVHVGDLMRTGSVTCNTCWKAQNANYLARTAAPTTVAEKTS